MTIDEIKQALQEVKEYCFDSLENSESPWLCDACPLAIDHMGHKRCPMRYMNGDLRLPFEWPIDWPEADTIGKNNAADPLTLNDYQRMARRTAGATRASDIMQEGKHEICVDVGEPCNHEKKYMNKGREIDYDRMTDAAYAAIMAIKLATHVLGCSIEDISKMDLDKYRPRYPGGFDPERSINREE